MDKKQSGSAHLVITIILAVALIGTLGFVYWQNFMQPKDSNKSVSVSKDATDNDEVTTKSEEAVETYDGYLVFDGWDIKSKLPSNLGTNKIVYQKVAGDNTGNYYDVSTERVSALGSDCAMLFRIMRSEEPFAAGVGAPTVIGKIGSYYYGLQGPQSLCTDIGADIQLEDSTMLRTVLNNIETK